MIEYLVPPLMAENNFRGLVRCTRWLEYAFATEPDPTSLLINSNPGIPTKHDLEIHTTQVEKLACIKRNCAYRPRTLGLIDWLLSGLKGPNKY